jgi:hypothetical protein
MALALALARHGTHTIHTHTLLLSFRALFETLPVGIHHYIDDATPVLESCLEQIAQQPSSGAHV